MKKLSFFFILFFSLFLISCEEENGNKNEGNGGIIITFDDATIEDWFKADSALSPYNWKATFCVSHYHECSSSDIQKLHILEESGHEIAGHGYNHLYASDYESEGKMQEYIELDIIPMIESMKQDSFEIRSFAYPGGQRNENTDVELLQYFDVIRGVGWGNKSWDPADHICFFENDPIVFGTGIDEHYPYFSEETYEQYILDLLKYARDNGKLVILYAHRTVETVTTDYQVSFSTLKLICSFVNDNSMDYYTLIDLKEFLE